MRELLLTSLGGRQYGIWKDAILSVRDLRALHRIPLSPPRIAGIMIDGGQTVTLADLSVCLGYEFVPATGPGCILLLAEGEQVAGFVVSGELRTQSISPERLFPLPEFLKTPVFDSCAVHNGISIPIINIAELYSRVLKNGEMSFVGAFHVPAARQQDVSGAEQIRFITVAGERYAVTAAGIDNKAVKPGPVTPLPDMPLPDMPQYAKGVTFHDGRLMAVIDLTQRIRRHSAVPDSWMLTAQITGATFGFLIDRDEGASSADKVSIKPVPLIAQTSWLKNVAMRAGELIPLVDLALVLSPDPGTADEKPLWQRYAAGSGFHDIFFKHEVGVMEFSLLGVCYALPKVEVEDVIAFKPCRALPDVVPIVLGVAEHNGEILPVVDLAMMFGRRSLTAPEWRMMLVNNGDFRALVITEAVFGERRLPPDLHRAVPIHLPHNLMYGCYPDENAVRIILNVEAIAVHFEKSLIQKFMPALSQEMRMSPAGVVYTFPEEKVGQAGKAVQAEEVAGQPQASANATPAQAEAEPVPEAAPMAEISQAVPEFVQQSEEQIAAFVELAEADTEAAAIAPEEEPVGEAEPVDIFLDAVSATSAPESLTTADEWNSGAAVEQEHVPRVSETTFAPDVMTTAAETQEHATPVQGVSDRQPSAQGNKAREPAAKSKKSPLELLKATAEKKQAQKVSATAPVDSRPAEPARTTASAESGEQYHSNRETGPLAEWSVYEEHAAGKMWKRTIAYGAIVAALIAVFYFAETSDQPAIEKSVQATAPAKVEQASAQPEQSRAEAVPVREEAKQDETKTQAEHEAKAQAEIEAKAKQKAKESARQTLMLSPLTEEQTKPPRPEKKSRAPLELDIPAEKPVDIDEYVVQEGDTLWSISQRFTGSPYNYPRIAGENRIAEPDLIFPGQRIRLIK